MATTPDTSSISSEATLVVFTARGLDTDTRLRIFDNVYHAHSVILKKGSAFFAKFLDSPDKQSEGVTSDGFKYDWTTHVDGDGKGWSLVAVKPGVQEPLKANDPTFRGSIRNEKECFNAFLRAIYGLPYSLPKSHYIAILEKQGDYYCALPVVSYGFSDAIDKSTLNNVGDYIDIVKFAYRLRHALWFRECVIIISGDWSANRNRATSLETVGNVKHLDPAIKIVIEKARAEIHKHVSNVHEDITRLCRTFKVLRACLAEAYDSADEEETLPNFYNRFYRILSQRDRLGDDEHEERTREKLCDSIGQLVKNNLNWNLHKEDYPQWGDWRDNHFLCAEVPDNDLPLDTKQLDW